LFEDDLTADADVGDGIFIFLIGTRLYAWARISQIVKRPLSLNINIKIDVDSIASCIISIQGIAAPNYARMRVKNGSRSFHLTIFTSSNRKSLAGRGYPPAQKSRQ